MNFQRLLHVLAVLLACSTPLFACDYTFYPSKPHSLIDPSVIKEVAFQNQARHSYGEDPVVDVQGDTMAEWQDYFATRRKQKFGLEEVRAMIEGKTTPFDDVNAYLEMVDKTNGSDDSAHPINEEAVQMASNKKLDGFLRAKYAYHAVASSVLSENWEEGIQYYEKLFLPMGVRSLLYYEAMGWKARALVRTNKVEEASALYAEMFDQCPAMRYEARRSLTMIDNPEALGAVAKNLKPGHRRITALYLQHLIGGRDYSASTLAEVTEHGPKEIQVEMMLVQMMQDIEGDQFETECPHLFGEPDFVEPDNTVLKMLTAPLHRKPAFADLVPVCEKAAADPKIRRSAFWSWGASYLALLSGDREAARRDIDKAAKAKGDDDSLKGALHLQETLVELAEHPKDFPSDLQKRLLVDLAQYAPPPTDQSNPIAKYWHRVRPGGNDLIESTLWALAIQKYIYMGKWAQACLLASTIASPSDQSYEDTKIDLTLFLDFASPEDLSKLKALLKHGFFATATPLEALALKKTNLTPKDMDLLIALRKANQFDFAGAVSDLEKDLTKDPDFLGTESRSVTTDYGNQTMGEFYKGTSIRPKRILFGYDYKKITMDGRTGDMDLLSYTKLMKSLFSDLGKGRKGTRP